MRKKVSRRTKRVAASVSSSAKGQIRSKSATIHDLYSTRYRSLRQMKQVETSETERKQLSRAAKAALTQIERTLERKGTRIPTLKQHEQAVTARSEYAPGLLVVRCKQDVITAVPDLQTATIASVRALTLPTATEGPFKDLERKQLIKEVVPVFSRLTRGRSFAIAPTSVAASFATSVQDSENEDLRGINVLRLSKAGLTGS